MKKKIGIFIIILTALLSTEELVKTMDFSTNDLLFMKQNEYDCVTIQGAKDNFEIGRPNLPVKVIHLVIPDNAEVQGIQFISTPVELAGVYKIVPVQRPFSFDDVEIEPMTLDSSQIYPQEIAKISNIGYFAGNKIVSVLVYPLQYLPVQGKLILNKNIQLTVKYHGSTTNGITKQRGFDKYNNKIEKTIRRFINNPEKLLVQPKENLPQIIEAQKFMPMDVPSKQGSSVEYVIITSDGLSSSFQTLADWKMEKGVPTVIKTTSWIESHYNGTDIQERIRNFIKDAYQKWGTEYILLGGDEGVVPARISTLNFCGQPTGFIPTDLYYACLDGNWNKDGDEHFGEEEDSVDLYPEVFVGRLPVNDSDEADVLITKIIDYETDPANGFITKVLFLGENLGAYPGDGKDRCDSIADFHFPEYYTKTKLYEFDGNENRNTVMSALNTGQGIVYFQGHGSTNTLGVGPDLLYHIDFDTLTNENKPSIWYGVSCYTNCFTCDCINEHFIKNASKGGVVSIASTSNDYPFDNFEFDKTFFEFLFDSSFYNIGEVQTLSKASLVGSYSHWQPYVTAMHGRMLLGDPEMPVWTTEPRAIYVTHLRSVGLGPTDFLVEVETISLEEPSDTVPLPDAKVCVKKGDEFHAYGYTNSQGEVKFKICPESKGDISVVVTKHNYATYQGNCEVESDIPYVSYMNHSINDSLGNDNDVCDAGEEVFLNMTLQNQGRGSADFVTAKLRTTNSYITILDSVEDFGRIGGSQSITKNNAYRISVAANTPDQSEINFSLAISASQGNYNDVFELDVYAPLLNHSGHSISQLSDKKERASTYKMKLKVRNDDSGEDNGVWASLDSDDSNVTITKDSIWIGTINARTEITSSDTFLFESSIPLDSISDFRVVISDIYDRTVSDTFVISTPPSPYNLAYQPYQNKIYLVWDVLPAPLYGFNVYRGDYGKVASVKVNETPITNGRYFTDCDLDPGTKYYYAVTSIDSSMNESPSSTDLLVSTNPKLKTGWPKIMEFDTDFSSPFACELDTIYPGLEIVSLDRFGTIYAWHCNGTGYLSSDGVFARTGMRSWTSPAAADIDLDGEMEIVYMGSRTNPETTKVFVYKRDGTLMWSKVIALKWSISSPLICQFDQDLELEIISVLTNGDIYLLDHTGRMTFFASCSATTFSSPALGDVNDNDKPDIWIGTKKGIYAWDNNGTPISPFIGWPDSNYHDFSSIVIGDIAEADTGYEIAAVDRCLFIAYIINKDGDCLQGWPTHFSLYDLLASPSLANLDSDNDLELIISSEPDVFAFNSDASVVDGFPVDRLANICSNPVIVDLDYDQDFEIIVGSGGEDSRFYGYHHNGEQILGFPIPIGQGATSTPFVGDIDGDDKLEMIVSCHDHKVYVYELDDAIDYPNCTPWPTFRHDLMRTGNYSTQGRLSSAVAGNDQFIPQTTLLKNIYPIPFTKNLNLQIDVAKESDITINFYNVAGIKVKDIRFGKISPGRHSLTLSRTMFKKQLANGVYFVRIIAKDENSVNDLGIVKVIYCR